MPNPFNPLEWLHSVQDWFARTERSSGFRPYLIFVIIVFIMGFLLLCFDDVRYADTVGLGLIVTVVFAFIVLYFIKAFTDPEFCRSEKHIEKIRKIELEKMGNESNIIEGHVVEKQLAMSTEKEPESLPPVSDCAERGEVR